MRLNTPSFWYDHNHPAAQAKAAALSALSAVYVIGHLLHQAVVRPAHAPVPVICIGNLVVGGGGKTPTAIAVMELIRKHGIFKNPCFLTRGYGGTLKGPVVIDPTLHPAPMAGDEPLLLAQIAPVIVAADRAKGARLAADQGYDAIIMDDGLQNPGLHKDFSLLVIDGNTGFGNEMLLPAGPLRTPIAAGIKKCDGVLLIGADKTNVLRHIPEGKPVLQASIIPVTLLDTIPDYLAFCGIAHPEKFWQTLDQAEMKVVEFQKFPDHHPYTETDLNMLMERAAVLNAIPVTTPKDAARLPVELLKSGKIQVMETSLNWTTEAEKNLKDLIWSTCRK